MALNVIFVSPEALPFAKTGGLADVACSLPVALKKLGCKVTLFLPFYRCVSDGGFDHEPTGIEVSVQMGPRTVPAEVLRGSHEGIPVYFIKRDEYYDRTYLYGTPEGDYFDNLERFVFFSKATLEAIKARGLKADCIHANDWQTALIPAYLKDAYRNDGYYRGTTTVFTIHNLAYQGLFPPELYDLTGLSPALYNPDGVEFWGKINLLKAGINYSDVVTTVSEAYSREIQTAEYGSGLEGVLARRSGSLFGILNGADYNEWDPEKDGLIPSKYSAADLRGKAVCKRKLIRDFGLRARPETMVIGMISRLAAQKGFDILSEAMPSLVRMDLALVILGTGEKKYQKLLEAMAAKYPGRVSAKMVFDNRLAHIIEAGSDAFLMPSRYEPCGLNQIYSLRYGTVPIVRATGGLEDTVIDHTEPGGNGFKFYEYTAEALVEKVREALEAFKDREAWRALQMNGMKADFSWERSAKKYMELYRKSRALGAVHAREAGSRNAQT